VAAAVLYLLGVILLDILTTVLQYAYWRTVAE
jgi:hypothetical protein